ncbi:hypothetical protein Aperf_G00000038013 [Anoplocephala perfoliata]
MPSQTWQPIFQSTSTASASHLPSASSPPSSVSYVTESRNDENKENGSKLAQKRRKSKVPTTKRRTPNMLTRRNERERNRVQLLNQGFDRLRTVVPKREGEYLSKICTLRKAIWYIEHLDRVLHEKPVAVAEQISADNGKVGTDLEAGSIIMEKSFGHQDADQGQERTEGEQLSPIFPSRMDELDFGKSFHSFFQH